MLIISLIFLRYPPKEINHYYGYRTKGSMKNQETWDFAQQYSSSLLLKVAIATCVVQIMTHFL